MEGLDPSDIARRAVLYPVSAVVLVAGILYGYGFQKESRAAQEKALAFDVLQRVLLPEPGAGPQSLPDTNLSLRKALHSAGEDAARELPPCEEAGRPHCVAGRVIVRFLAGTSKQRHYHLIKTQRARVAKVLSERTGTYLVALPRGMPVAEGVRRFAMMKEVDFAEPDFLY